MVRNEIKRFKGRFFILPDQERNLSISFNDIKNTLSERILVKKNNDFCNKYFSEVSFSSISSYQLFSLVSSFIPFFQHNDANRTLMGIGMQKQAVILIKREAAIVSSGIFKQLLGKGTFIDRVNSSGFITFFSDKKIFLKSYEYLKKSFIKNKIFWKKISLDLKLKNLSNFISVLRSQSSNFYFSGQNNSLLNYYFNRKESRVVSKEIIKGDSVKNSTMLGVGKNIFLSYMSWKGYNFEDAIVINEKLIDSDLLTSLHVKKYIVFLLSDRLGSALKLINFDILFILNFLFYLRFLIFY